MDGWMEGTRKVKEEEKVRVQREKRSERRIREKLVKE